MCSACQPVTLCTPGRGSLLVCDGEPETTWRTYAATFIVRAFACAYPPAVIAPMCTRVFNTWHLVRANQIDITEFSNLGKAVETIPIDTPLHGGSVFQSRSIIECSMLFLVCFLV